MSSLRPPVVAAGDEPAMGAVPALGAHNETIRAEFARWKDVPA